VQRLAENRSRQQYQHLNPDADFSGQNERFLYRLLPGNGQNKRAEKYRQLSPGGNFARYLMCVVVRKLFKKNLTGVANNET